MLLRGESFRASSVMVNKPKTASCCVACLFINKMTTKIVIIKNSPVIADCANKIPETCDVDIIEFVPNLHPPTASDGIKIINDLTRQETNTWSDCHSTDVHS